MAALEGIVHSFQDNSDLGDCGPTIILKTPKGRFHILYFMCGHLSSESLDDLKIGQTFKQGELMAQLRTVPIKGDYAPAFTFSNDYF